MATADTAELTPQEAPQPSVWQTVQQNFNALTQRQKMAGAAAIAIAIAVIVGLLLWTKEPAYSVLFSNLDDRDGGAIINTLQQQNVPYRYSTGGGAIMVPTEQVHDIRLRLAADGLPRGGMVGFELMENQKIGLSQFHEQVNYQRALEGELSRTIQAISSVATARVHLAIPKQTAFLRNDQQPTASVLVTLRGGRFLDENQIAGIRHLISSSVPRLTNEAVSIVDQAGNLLTKQPDPDRVAGLNPQQLGYVKDIEEGYIHRIENILKPMLGSNNFRAQVTADIDFNATEQTSELYKPNPSPDQAIRSQQTSETLNRVGGPQGVPGALTNQPPVPATAPVTNPAVDGSGNSTQNGSATRSALINYEVDRTVQHVRQSVGQVKRLTAAVVVNHKMETQADGKTTAVPLTDAELERITNLVKEAMGFNQARGDSVNVATSPFAPLEDSIPETLPPWKDPEIIAIGLENLKYVVALIIALVVYFAVLRPLMRTVLPPPPKEAEADATEDAEAGEGGEEDEDAEVSLSPEALAGMTFEDKLARARELAKNDPRMVANLIRDWMGVGEEGRK